MILTQQFRRTASRQAKVVILMLSACVPPFAATALSEETDEPLPSSGMPVRDSGKNPDRGLNAVAHWRFQKGISGSAADSAQVIEDSSGNSRHGRAVGGPLYHAVELPTTRLALAFDGHNDRIVIADDPMFHLTQSFTIEAWIEVAFYPESASKLSHIAFRGDNRLGFDPWFLAITESGQLRFLISDSVGQSSVIVSPEPLPTRKLIHIAAVLDDETGTQSLFIDGKRVATTETSVRAGGPLGGTGAGVAIGGRTDQSNQGFRGSIGELRITAEALTRPEFLLPMQDSDDMALAK